MRNEQEVLEVTTAFPREPDGRASSPSDAVGAGDRADQPAPLDKRAAAASPSVPHDVPPEIKKAMLAAAYAQLTIDRLAALQNEEVIKYTGISRSELGLRVWNAPLAEVAGRLGLKKHVLRRICILFEVPLPPKGYFNTSFAQRPIRWTRVVGAGTR